MIQRLRHKSEFEVERYMILTQTDFKAKLTYVVELTLCTPHNVVKGDEVRNIEGESFITTGVTPEKLTIIGESMDHLSAMIGLWGIGLHFKIEPE
jgi:hypothetical protein